jgi:hypothetical protein
MAPVGGRDAGTQVGEVDVKRAARTRKNPDLLVELRVPLLFEREDFRRNG